MNLRFKSNFTANISHHFLCHSSQDSVMMLFDAIHIHMQCCLSIYIYKINIDYREGYTDIYRVLAIILFSNLSCCI